MFRPINITADGGRLKSYARSRLVERGEGVRIGWGADSSFENESQSACRVTLTADGLSWDSGWREQSAQFLRCDARLPEGLPVTVAVTLRDSHGRESDTAREVIYNASIDWRAGWITLGHEDERTLYFRREFTVEAGLESAVLYVCGIGYQTVSLNGEVVDCAALDPAHTDYTKTCQYVTYPEFEKRLKPGANCLGVQVGTGWRHNSFSGRDMGGGRVMAFTGPIQLTAMLRLTYEGGHTEWILTDERWQAGHGARVSSDLFNGEICDANQAAVGWDKIGYTGFAAAEGADAPGGVMKPMILNPIIEHNARKAVACWPIGEDSYILDFGQNIAGVVRVRMPDRMKKGQTVTMQHAEELDENGTLYTAPLRSAQATDRYTASGDERDFAIWQPRNTYHGFRYVRVTGLGDAFDADRFEAVELHTDLEKKSFFRCGEARVNALHEMCAATERANQHSILTDCPQRDERQGWMNDATVRFEETPYNFEIGRMFPKLIRDLIDEQGADGAITCTAPFVYGGRPADPVCSSFLVAGYECLLHDGNDDAIREAFDRFAAWENCLIAHSDEYIVNYSYYGDWAGPAYACTDVNSAPSAVTPGVFMSSGYSYYNCRLLALFAARLNRAGDEKHWLDMAERVKAAIIGKWYNAETAVMATGSMACQVFSLWLGLIPESDRARAIKRVHDELIESGDRFTTGNLCTRYLMDMLCEGGYLEDAWRLAIRQDYPSWGYMAQQEATTVWERFELKKNPGMNSHNHPMYGAVDYWLYAYIAGIRPLTAGYEQILIKPYMPEGLMSAQAVVDTARGEVAVRWMKRYGGTHLHVTVPFGATARVEFMGETHEVGSGFHAFSVGSAG